MHSRGRRSAELGAELPQKSAFAFTTQFTCFTRTESTDIALLYYYSSCLRNLHLCLLESRDIFFLRINQGQRINMPTLTVKSTTIAYVLMTYDAMR